jgi:hypothetical protein
MTMRPSADKRGGAALCCQCGNLRSNGPKRMARREPHRRNDQLPPGVCKVNKGRGFLAFAISDTVVEKTVGRAVIRPSRTND